jgi:hypothetical protein
MGGRPMTLFRFLLAVVAAVILLPILSRTVVAGEDWKPIDPDQLAQKAPIVEKDADAEVIFWEVRVNDAGEDLVFNHYLRIKVFTDRGKESQSKIDITYRGNRRIADIAGRTVKPDGTIVELKKDAIFERTIVKVGSLKYKAKSFAMPAVEPGAIIEYRWKEVRPGAWANYVRLHFQRDIPIQSVKYYLKPAPPEMVGGAGMATRMFNGEPSPFTKEKDGFYSVGMTNVPAFREEPRMPPEDQVRRWMLVFYPREKDLNATKFWPKFGKDVYDVSKSSLKVNDDIKRAAASAIGDATTSEEKLKRLFDFCREKVKNVNDVSTGLTESEREKVKDNHSPADTLKRGMGSGSDIDNLFGALALAAGFEARIALLGDRSDMFFDPNFPSPYFVSRAEIAVKVGEKWEFFDPATTYLPLGMLRWEEEGMHALVADSKQGFFVDTPLSPAEKSVEKRDAKLKLNEDGSIEGDVRIEYTGHLGFERKDANDDASQAQREQNLVDLIKERMSAAEVSAIKVENVTDSVKPFVYEFHVRVPGYAQRTGKRLFLQPAFFEHGLGALFTSGERRYPVYFHYPWSEDDTVTIELPRGFELDHADQPAPFHSQNVADYQVKIQALNKNEKLIYNRKFSFQGLLFPVESYKGVKQLFDMLHESDNHTITLKQVVTASNQD